jgi:hypothetical protein
MEEKSIVENRKEWTPTVPLFAGCNLDQETTYQVWPCAVAQALHLFLQCGTHKGYGMFVERADE